MNKASFLVFIIVLQVLFLLTDAYVLHRWKKFVQQKQWNKLLFTVPYMVMFLAVVCNIYVNVRRMNVGAIPLFDLILYNAVIVWYLPKLPIALTLLFTDSIKFLKWSWNRISLHKKTPSLSETVQENIPRRELLKNVGWSLAVAPFIIVGDGLLRKVTNFHVNSLDLPVKDLPRALEGLKIIQISDLHAGSIPNGSHIQEVRRIINTLSADMVFMTGDFVNFRSDEYISIAKDIQKIKADIGVYACLGNHDHYSEYSDHKRLISMIKESDVHLLINANRVLNIDGAQIQIAGVDNTGLRQSFAKLDKALMNLQPEFPTFLLAHDPTFWDKEVREKTFVDAMFSGHTHGGQVGVHILGVEMSVAQVVYKQWAGLYSDKNQQLYVNRGVGVVGPPLRIGIDPEITEFILRKA